MKNSDKKRVTILREEDFLSGLYRLVWEGSDPLEPGDLRELKKLIEDWAIGKVPDKTIALEAPRILDEVIQGLQGLDDELTRSWKDRET